jgi:hypothetical protein
MGAISNKEDDLTLEEMNGWTNEYM